MADRGGHRGLPVPVVVVTMSATQLNMAVTDLAQLLLETALRHGEFEAVAPPHDWWDWYAAYIGRAPERLHAG
jgi:hypothetical protein